jgi:4-diphosphocytidyl-2C-methyl-D-erythritol kinase
MSGSGPSVFGIYGDEATAHKAAAKLKTICSDIFVTKAYD